MEFKGTKSILTMPCGSTSGTPQDKPSNAIYSKGKILAKVYGETPEEATANALIFTQSFKMWELLGDINGALAMKGDSDFLILMDEIDLLRKQATKI